MKKIMMSVAALCALFAAPSLAEAAVRGIATANVNMRSGPSTGYPAVVVVPVGAPLMINGCMSTVNWCDVSFTGGRGWVSGNYITATYRSNRVSVEPDYYRDLGIPQTNFDVNTYWGRYYRDRDFYRDRDRWRGYNWRSERQLPPPPDRQLPPPPPPRWDPNGPRPFDRDRAQGEWRPGDREPPPPPRWQLPGDNNRFDNRLPPPPPAGPGACPPGAVNCN